MIQVVIRYSTIFVGLVVGGLICNMAAGYLMSPRGAVGPTVLQAESPITAIVVVVVAVGLATCVAGLAGRLTNAAVGCFVLGGSLYALAYQTATIEELAYSSGSIMLVKLELVLWALLMLPALFILFKIAGPIPDMVILNQEKPNCLGLFSLASFKSAALGLAVVPVVWVIAQSPMKGQVVGAVLVGGIVAGAASRVLFPHVQPIWLFVTPLLFGAIGHWIGLMGLQSTLSAAYVADELSPLNLPMPIDYVCGTLAGVAIGLGMARSFMHGEEHESAPAKKATATP